MNRIDIINKVGCEFLTENAENGEFNYKSAYKEAHLPFSPIKVGRRSFEQVDIRFEKNNLTILVETKQNINLSKDLKQLSAYVQYEKGLTRNKIIAILASTKSDDIKVYRGIVSDSDYLPNESDFRTIDEYIDFYSSRVNDKEGVMQNTYKLNELLHRYSIPADLRSQFVGTCLLAIKNNLDYSSPSLSSKQIRTGIKEVLESLLERDLKKAEKLALLNQYVLEDQYVSNLDVNALREILDFIKNNIIPFINDRSTSGQDLLNLFFVTFNKYVNKKDKNQAFTPDHITDFMSKVVGVNKHSVVLDPCCGSGSFLVRAMTLALDDCATAAEQNNIKKNQIYGIEFDDKIYGLATTNMLIHSDGNSNIKKGSCFDLGDWIKDAKPNIILMNPPYNGQRIHLPKEFTRTWGSKKKQDPSKGFYFVKYIADLLNSCNIRATLAVLLPVACAIGGNNKVIKKIKKDILKDNYLRAVFTLPNEIFYPGASASACCMIFEIGKKHKDNPDTFFGYYKDDGFKKKKNLGRVEQIDQGSGKSKWSKIEEKWLDTYKRNIAVDGLSALKKVSYTDEWLCEAYMKTDYKQLSNKDFQQTINNFLSYLVKRGNIYESKH